MPIIYVSNVCYSVNIRALHCREYVAQWECKWKIELDLLIGDKNE